MTFNQAKKLLRAKGYRISRMAEAGDPLNAIFSGQYAVSVGSLSQGDYKSFLLDANQIKQGAVKLQQLANN